MNRRMLMVAMPLGVGLSGAVVAAALPSTQKGFDASITRYAQTLLDQGRTIFRYDTFGSEAFWGDALQLHKAIAGEKNGRLPVRVNLDRISARKECPHLTRSPPTAAPGVPGQDKTAASMMLETCPVYARSLPNWGAASRPAIHSRG
jgi:hypothetical protein